MSKARITERQQYWRDHVIAAASYDGSIVEYGMPDHLFTGNFASERNTDCISEGGKFPVSEGG